MAQRNSAQNPTVVYLFSTKLYKNSARFELIPTTTSSETLVGWLKKSTKLHGTTSVGHRLFKWKKWRIFFRFKSTHFFHRCRTLVSIVYYLKRIGLPNFLGKFGITFMSTGLPRLRMAIVKLNKLQRMPENMSQLLSNKTHMPKNLYQMSSENSYSLVHSFIYRAWCCATWP